MNLYETSAPWLIKINSFTPIYYSCFAQTNRRLGALPAGRQLPLPSCPGHLQSALSQTNLDHSSSSTSGSSVQGLKAGGGC